MSDQDFLLNLLLRMNLPRLIALDPDVQEAMREVRLDHRGSGSLGDYSWRLHTAQRIFNPRTPVKVVASGDDEEESAVIPRLRCRFCGWVCTSSLLPRGQKRTMNNYFSALRRHVRAKHTQVFASIRQSMG